MNTKKRLFTLEGEFMKNSKHRQSAVRLIFCLVANCVVCGNAIAEDLIDDQGKSSNVTKLEGWTGFDQAVIGLDRSQNDRVKQALGSASLISFNRNGTSWYMQFVKGTHFLVGYDGTNFTARHKVSDKIYAPIPQDFYCASTDHISSNPAVWPFETYLEEMASRSVGKYHYLVRDGGVFRYDGAKWIDYCPYHAEKELFAKHRWKDYQGSRYGLGYFVPIGWILSLAVSPNGEKAIAANSRYLHFFDGKKWEVKPFPLLLDLKDRFLGEDGEFKQCVAFAVDNSGRIYVHVNRGTGTDVFCFQWEMDFGKPFEKEFQYWLKKMQSDSVVERDRAVWAMASFRLTFFDRIQVVLESSDNEELRGRLQNAITLVNKRDVDPGPEGYLGVIDDLIFSRAHTMVMDRDGTLQIRAKQVLIEDKWVENQIITRKADGTATIVPASTLVDPRPEGYRDYKILATADDGRMILAGKGGRFLYKPATPADEQISENGK